MFPQLDVSRETQERLKVFCAMVERWNKAINLVAPAAIPDLWNRHIIDSAQLFSFLPESTQHWLDIGSGGGFPGLVIAACLRDTLSHCRVTLIESDQRKAVFLREAARAMGLQTYVLATRIEIAPPQQADVISARALAPLPRLLSLTKPHLNPGGLAIFPKGESVSGEILEAQSAGWRFDPVHHTSLTDPAGVILTLRNIRLESAD